MSYEKALEAAGARIVAFEYFGSYQGEWWALVEFRRARGWVNGSYGSCSGCDSFEAEFGYGEREANHDNLADFGQVYLDTLLTQQQALESAGRNVSWDSDAQAMLNFIQANPA